MGAHPKQKISNSRRHSKRAHQALTARNFGRCPTCRSLVPQHRVCPVCGEYGGEEILVTEEATVRKYR